MFFTKSVRVGVGALIIHDHKVLLGKRKGSHGANTWELPGGNLEFGETFEECAIREALEETGLVLDPASAKFVTANNNVMKDIGRHYVDIFISAKVLGDPTPKIMEPRYCECWVWVTLEQLLDNDGPYRPLFSPLAKMIEEHDLTSMFA